MPTVVGYIRCSCGQHPEWIPINVDSIPGRPLGPPIAGICPTCGRQETILVNEPSAHCWGINCNSNPIYRVGYADGPYGNYCSACGRTLRQHPFFGEDRVYDMGNPATWNSWKALTPQQQIEVYRANGFRAPRRLLDIVNVEIADPPPVIHPAQY